METLTIKIPNGKSPAVASYVKEIGGEVISKKNKSDNDIDEDNEVTHEVYFGENIRRLIKAFKR